MKDLSQNVERAIHVLLQQEGGHAAREDSRAFGAMIEARITDGWIELCGQLGATPVASPGRRTIYDCAFTLDGVKMGFDIKTKDLDSTRYSDGGVCAVSNLMKFLANDAAIFMIVEVGHQQSKSNRAMRDVSYIHVAPFHLLPINSYRIENLGTGQVRLNYSVKDMYNEIDWGRDIKYFFDKFTAITIAHYSRVVRDAESRIDYMNKFKKREYKEFKMNGAR